MDRDMLIDILNEREEEWTEKDLAIILQWTGSWFNPNRTMVEAYMDEYFVHKAPVQEAQLELTIQNNELVVDGNPIDWDRYIFTASIVGQQECTMGPDGIDWGSTEVTGTQFIIIHDTEDTMTNQFVGEVEVDGMEDDSIIEIVRRRIEEYEAEEAKQSA